MCRADFHDLDFLSPLDTLQDSNKAKNWIVETFYKILDLIFNLLSIEPGHGLLRGGVAGLARPPPTLGTLSGGLQQEGGEN